MGERANIPFTDDQVEYLTERDARMEENSGRAVKKGLRHHGRNIAIGFAILTAGFAGSFYTAEHDRAVSRHTAIEQRKAIVQSGRVVAVDGCNRDFTTITRLRGVLVNAKKFQEGAVARGELSPAAAARADAYYDAQLAGLPLPDCRAAKNIITDDPTAPKAVPDPKYPAPPPK